jgi:hypothetical protein
MRDFGVAVSSGWLHGPLGRVSPRALRLWLFLAGKSLHAPFTRVCAGQRVNVQRGEVITSMRQLQRDAEYHSPASLIADLKELADAKTIEARSIRRDEGERFKNRNASASEVETLGRSKNRNAGLTLATVIKVLCHQCLAGRSVSEFETKRGTGVFNARERTEIERFEAQMAREGR